MSSEDEKKDLAYYEAHPEELAELSVDEIDALYAPAEGVDGAHKPEGDTASSEAPGAAATQPNGQAKDDQGQEAPPAGVATRDGKDVIPYTVLEGVRQAKGVLEETVREQAEEIARLKAQVEGGKPEAAKSVTFLTEEQLADVEAETPTLGAALRASQQQIIALTQTVQELTAEREDARRTTEQQIQTSVQEAIDNTPKLAHLQGTDKQGWEQAVAIDVHLRTLPRWKGKPYSERFAEVVRRYEEDYGPIAMPGAPSQTPPKQPEPPKPGAQPSSAAAPTGPTTLSDLPGGGVPATDEVAALEQMSSLQVTAMFERMTPEQMEAYLVRNG